MASKMKSHRKSFPTTAAEAWGAILEFLSSDGSDDELHTRSKAGLLLLEQNGSNRELHKMRMALFARRTEKAVVRKS